MKYKVIIKPKALKQLQKLDSYIRRRIYNWIVHNLENCENPRLNGKSLVGDELGAQWRYRIGDYRILAQIDDEMVIIYVVRIGHRREIYEVHDEEDCLQSGFLTIPPQF